MLVNEIKDAVDNNHLVIWHNTAYRVIKDNLGQYLIHCTLNDTYVGLTNVNGELNENPEDFKVIRASVMF